MYVCVRVRVRVFNLYLKVHGDLDWEPLVVFEKFAALKAARSATPARFLFCAALHKHGHRHRHASARLVRR